MNCHRTPPAGTDIQVQLLKAPLAVLREMDFVAPDVNYPATGTYFTNAWIKAKQDAARADAENVKITSTGNGKSKVKRGDLRSKM